MKRIIAIVIIIVLIVVIRSIILSINSLSDNNKSLTELKNDLITKKRENQLLKEKLHYVKSDEFIEFEARNKLGLTRKDEYMVLVPQDPNKATTEQIEIEEVPNWEKWKKLFF